MADFAMCLDRFCPSRNHCRRFTATASDKQSFNDFQRNGRPCCDSYWPVERSVKEKEEADA